MAISIEFEEEDAAIILLLHQYSSRNIGITEEKFIDIVINENSEMQREEIMDRINKLHSYRCIDINNGNIYLVEKL